MGNLAGVLPDVEIAAIEPVIAEIEALKQSRRAVVLAHNYMTPDIFHGVADLRGDSLALARMAVNTSADVIVMAGVHFMAETAKILNPGKTVLIPDLRAGCSLAESITGADVRLLRQRYPGVPVVTYVNTYADVKAETDICCTSSNAKAVVESLGTDTVIFLPDEYLARNVARETGKQLVGWQGRCEVHERFTVEDVTSVRRQFPDVVVLAHPECSPEVIEASDASASTSQMIRYVRESKVPRYLLLTECAMADNVAAANPDKEMLRLCSVRCPHMNRVTLEAVRDALRYDRHAVEIPEEIRRRAARSIERMLAFG